MAMPEVKSYPRDLSGMPWLKFCDSGTNRAFSYQRVPRHTMGYSMSYYAISGKRVLTCALYRDALIGPAASRKLSPSRISLPSNIGKGNYRHWWPIPFRPVVAQIWA